MPETTPHPAAPSTGMKRRRAARACLSCRSRKVRCDVSRSGPPCMNCSLDSIACVVKGRKPKSSARGRRTSEASVASPDQCDEVAAEASPSQAAEDLMQLEDAALNHETLAGLDQLAAYNQHDEPPAEQTVDLMYGGVDRPEFQMDTGGLMHTAIHEPPQPTTDASMLFPDNWLSACVQGSEADCLEIPDRFRPNTTRANSVMYTYYPFLTLDNLYDVLPQDVEFLEAEGCFHLPTRRIMDRILQQYFLHVHPLLPLLNEGDFWEMYYNKGTGSGGGPKMSLLVFQAIMFVSCNFVNWSLESAKKFGYKDIRGLRAAFYRRAKLLYDFGVESSPVAIAQAALLLSHWTPPVRADMMPNTVWLSIAIQNAKNIQAPYAATLPPPSGGSSSSSAEAKRNNTLKRLWWCCVLRDRVLPLGLRRGIQITRAHFDFERHRPLGLMDLDDEIHRSAVYGADAKRELIRILSQVLDLCVILTDVLLLVFPLDSACGDLQQQVRGEREQRQQALPPLKEVEIRNNKKALVHWYTSAVAAGEGGSEINWNRHESVIVYTHWMYTYYHSARMALYHHELQHYLALMADNTFIETQRILETRDAIQNAFSNITESLRGLNQRQLTRWLPISATAYIAFPLALHVLNSRLSAAIVRSSPTNGTLIEVMKAMHLQYDGVDWVARLIGFLVDLVQDDLAVHNNNSNKNSSSNNSSNNDNNSNNNSTSAAGGAGTVTTTTTTTTVADWAELLAVRPRTYLRLSLAMDLSMSSGRFPDKTDFLARLDDTMRGSAPRLHGANHLHHSHHNHMHHRSARPMRSLPGPTSRPHGVFDAYAAPWRTPRGTAPPSRGGGSGGGGLGNRPVAVPQQEEQEQQQQQQQQPAGGSGGDATATTTATASTTALHRDGGNDGYVVPGEEDAMCDAAYLDALGEGFAADADLDRFTSLPDDLDDFFDPTLGDLTSSEESPASKSLDADIDNALMAAAGHEMIQL